MTSLANWISPSTMRSLGWTLLHFLWQGTALAALAAVLMSLCRRAARRYAVGVGVLSLMLAAPVVTFFVLMPSRAAKASDFSSIAQEEAGAAGNLLAKMPSRISLSSHSIDHFPWMVEAWLIGVAFFSLRSAGAFLLLERERRKQSSRVSDRVLMLCQVLQRKLGLDRTIRYYQCRWLQAPAVLGWFRPIVLLPVTVLTGLSEEQLQSIVAHELAHIRHYDAFVNVFQIGIETLLFYHPAVWWLNKRIRAEREHYCDDIAVTLCGNAVEYARALLLMEEWRTAPALAMAANRGPLPQRIGRLIGFKSSGARARRVGLAGGILCLTTALVSGNALLRIAYPSVHAGAASFAQISPAPFALAAPTQSPSAPAHDATPAPKPSPARPQAASESAPSGSYIDGLKSAGLNDFTVDQLIAMKIQGVTPDDVRDLHGLNFTPTADQLVSMRIQGITPNYVHELKDAGVQATIDQLIAMKIQDVTPGYVRAMHEQGLAPDADKLVAMRIQDLTPDYVRDVHALGMQPTVEQFISMRIQRVTTNYIKGLRAAGFQFSVDEVISAKIQQIDEQFIQRVIQHGFPNLNVEQLIQLKNSGVLEPKADI
jgi:beta-lactamase regulating signal transducer with metallopeptidase domain